MLLYAARQAGAGDQGAAWPRAMRCTPTLSRCCDACGAIPSTHDYHFNRFLFEAFPRGIDFPPLPDPLPPPELPHAPARAFSIDDAATTEIDDAFSVRPLANGNLEIGIHIAAPALAIPRGTPLDAVARVAAVDGVHAGPQDHHAAGCGDRLFFAGARRRASGAVAVRRDDARRHAGQARHATGARADRRQPAPRCHRRPLRAGRGARASPNGPTSCARCGGSRRSSNRRAARTTCARTDYTFHVDWDAAADGRVTIVSAPARLAARQARRRADDPRQRALGRAARRRGPAGAVSHAADGQGQDEHAAGAAPGARRRAIPVVEFAAASIQRPDQSAPAAGRDRAAHPRHTAMATPSCSPPWPTSRSPTPSTPSSRAGWSTTGACAGCSRKRSTSPRRPSLRDNLVRFDAVPLYVRVADLPASPPETRVRLGMGRIDLLAATIEMHLFGGRNRLRPWPGGDILSSYAKGIPLPSRRDPRRGRRRRREEAAGTAARSGREDARAADDVAAVPVRGCRARQSPAGQRDRLVDPSAHGRAGDSFQPFRRAPFRPQRSAARSGPGQRQVGIRSRPRPTSSRRRAWMAGATPMPTAARKRRCPYRSRKAPAQDLAVATQQVSELEARTREMLTQFKSMDAGRAADAEAQRCTRGPGAAERQRNDAADAGDDAAGSADRQADGRLSEAAQAPLRRRARRGVPVRALRRGLADEGRRHRQPQLSRRRRASRNSTAAC